MYLDIRYLCHIHSFFPLQYRENLLMVAMRAHQMEMVEFLIDNGVDYNYETTLIVSTSTHVTIVC